MASETSEAATIETLLTLSLEELIEVEISSATGTSKTIRTAPAVASVITAEDIEKMGATTLDEVLETVPGFHVVPNSFSYFTPMWSVRGIQLGLNPHVLMLVNGVPFKSTFTGDRNQTFKMLVQKISRVEVIRGPGSAVHGADAFAGVVNVITKDGQEISGSTIGASAGSFDTYGAWVQHGNVYNEWDLSLTLEAWKTNGDPDRIIERDRLGSGPPSNTPVELGAWHDMVDLTLGLSKDEWTFHLYGSLQDDFGGAGAIQAITDYDVDTKYLLTDLTYRKDDLIEDLDLSIRLHYLYLFDDVFAQILPPSLLDQKGNPIVTNQEVGIEATTFYEGFDDHRLRLSGGGSYVDVDTKEYKNWGQCVGAQFGPMVDVSDTPCVFLEPNARSLWYLSLQDEWAFAQNWELTGGVRYDHYSDFGGTTNPRLALVWETRPDLTTKLLYGRAFRAPSFAELYAKNNVAATGNPDLDPEEIDSLELVFDYRLVQKLRTTLNLFTYRAENLIEFVPPSPKVAQNYGKQDGYGFEFELDWLALDSLRIRSNFAWQRSKNKNLDATVPDAPEMQFYLNPHWTFLPDWSLDGQLFWVGKRHRHPDDPREDIDDYTTVNLNVRRKNIAKHWDIAVGIRNLFDADIWEPSPYDPEAPLGAFIPNDYPMEGRSIWGEVRFHFQ